MRLIPILTAVLVIGALYVLVAERDKLAEFAAGDSVEAVAAPATETAEASETATEEPGGKKVRVVALRSEATMIDSAVILRGETEANREVEVRAETGGLVISEPLRRGSHVEFGQELCRLEAGTRDAILAEAKARLVEARARVPSTEAGVAEAEARLEEARINDNAARKLSEGGFASSTRVASAAAAVRAAEAGLQSARSGLDSTQAGIESAEALVAAAQRDIDRLVVTAPFSGILESDTAELGSLVQQGSLCGTVIQLDPIRIVGFVPETEINRVNVGALAGARLTTGEQVTGQVTFVSRSADPLTRTFRVEVAIPNEDLRIRDGQTAEIAISSDGAEAHLVPQSALTLNDDGTLGVRLVGDNDVVEFVPVELLRDVAEGIWIEGPPHEANIIIIGQEYVEEGVTVLPFYEEPA
ncbi:multidrug efflux system membrane fusion protein [Shimia isoporae]|uniref:Multidrug efflux system membrane fusion protein n=1 Tax=Shimia isoporae TaxID=647720 RepID=A0A4R1NL80_9RHOB|nr:efflux RND transporter periplasmic adaptor subunit [Shimia isoporae]TCL09106.1 multidrug efflux system membrane fusion protein [Shimia isoporae]